MGNRWNTKWAGQHVIHYEVTDSTNLRAKSLGEKGSHGTIILAERQTAGRGRRGRNWESESTGNIYMSLCLKPKFAPDKASMLTLIMAYAVAKVLRSRYNMEAQIKWPNDLVLNKKKICGILTEMTLRQAEIDTVIIGVGINLGNTLFPEELQNTATSVFLETGKLIEREGLIEQILQEFEVTYESFCVTEDLAAICESYNHMLVNRNQEVRVLDPQKPFGGKAQGINYKGELIVEKEDGTKEAVFAGEVSVRGIYGYV